MSNNLFIIKDNKVGFLNAPFIAPNSLSAKRMFADLVNSKDTMIAKHPEDFELYSCGQQDEDTGVISCDKVTFLANATEYVAK